MSASINEQGNGKFQVSGDLNAATVPGLLHTSEKMIQAAGGDLHFDLSTVARCDSAGVALLIDWMRQAKSRQLAIKFENLPDQMKAIAQVSDLEELFQIVG